MATQQQYSSEQQAAVAAAVAAAATSAGLAGASLANYTVWMRFLRLIFPVVLRSRERAAWSARQFYDAERLRVLGLNPLPAPLVNYTFERFAANMQPAYKMVVKQVAVARGAERQGLLAPAPKIIPAVRVTVAREVADAGRDQIMAQVDADNAFIEAKIAELKAKGRQRRTPKTDQAVVDELKALLAGEPVGKTRVTWGGNTVVDPTSGVVKDLDSPAPTVVGWARVAQGEKTCAWCLMLVSRGPVYRTAKSAGSTLSSGDAVEKFTATADLQPFMEPDKFHVGCDCTIVPVFNRKNWPGRDEYKKALQVWQTASRKASTAPDKKYRVRYTKPDGTYYYRTETLMPGEAATRETLIKIRQQLVAN